MPNHVPARTANRLLAGLPRRDRLALLRDSASVALDFGEPLCVAHHAYRYAYFPESGFVSLVATVGRHPPLEMGMIGREGVLGATLLLGVSTAPLSAVVQGQGMALRVTAACLRRELAQRPALRAAVGRYLYALVSQLTQNAACTHFHEVEPRLARWLLMTHDRTEGDRLQLTHQFLADMLGVQRSAITIAAGTLQRAELINYTRGRIIVLCRAGLERAACACYAAVATDRRPSRS